VDQAEARPTKMLGRLISLWVRLQPDIAAFIAGIATGIYTPPTTT
jgi:hypothetical protein